jgi:hypothetical protein
VLLPAALPPRRRDSVEAVGAVLVALAGGGGDQSTAAAAGLAWSTVRNWRRTPTGGHVEALRVIGTHSYYELDANRSRLILPAALSPTPWRR